LEGRLAHFYLRARLVTVEADGALGLRLDPGSPLTLTGSPGWPRASTLQLEDDVLYGGSWTNFLMFDSTPPFRLLRRADLSSEIDHLIRFGDTMVMGLRSGALMGIDLPSGQSAPDLPGSATSMRARGP
jgi:hypothetical protein